MATEKEKIGRNGPCPCGSGKKYKKCCYRDKTRAWKTAGSHESPVFTVEPKETLEPITNHLVSSDGGKTWSPQPGLLVAQIIGKHPEDEDEAVRKIVHPISREIDDVNVPNTIKQSLRERIRIVDHKLHAVKYHLSNYERAESGRIASFTKNHKPPAGVQMIFEEPELIYEVEALLFQVKSCLDVLSRVLMPVFGFAYCSFGDKGDDVIKLLKNNCPAKLTPYAQPIIQLTEESQDAWIVELIDMRDQITHYSHLKGFNCFVEDPYLRGDTATIHYPTMPNQRRALEYCQDIWLGF